MNKCLNCGNPIEIKEGRRPRQYCDNKGKCRNEYWRGKNKPKLKEGKLYSWINGKLVEVDQKIFIQNLNQPTNEIKPQEQQKTNYTVDTKVKTFEQLLADAKEGKLNTAEFSKAKLSAAQSELILRKQKESNL